MFETANDKRLNSSPKQLIYVRKGTTHVYLKHNMVLGKYNIATYFSYIIHNGKEKNKSFLIIDNANNHFNQYTVKVCSFLGFNLFLMKTVWTGIPNSCKEIVVTKSYQRMKLNSWTNRDTIVTKKCSVWFGWTRFQQNWNKNWCTYIILKEH